ncbi:hypothetical protein EIN_185600 [Entamoeba invadens IP1]|uniref:hypothetical protein n=1 Tax=Entamoeba invadens IP1 TaxID=370355 RepID=UPI0002C3F061|nr:hypothetical protein EIN_185600 [Entamoeba invadens IP1]ELP94163.1 hypothetical protein EIN_185600 [Entamoeba invadens IP1]|eukprot:XP_004260934.1 hypothetical protein EIN_185600 [Entamoeba invadens IP1]
MAPLLLLFITTLVIYAQSESTMEVTLLPNGDYLHHIKFLWSHTDQSSSYPDGNNLPAMFYLNRRYNVTQSEVVMSRGTWSEQYGLLPFSVESGSVIALEATSRLDQTYYLALSTLLQNTGYQGISVHPHDILNAIHNMTVTHYFVAPSDWSCLENVIRVRSLFPKMAHSNLLSNKILTSDLYTFRIRQTLTEFTADVFLIIKSVHGTHKVFSFYDDYTDGMVKVLSKHTIIANGKLLKKDTTFSGRKSLVLMRNSDVVLENTLPIEQRYMYVSGAGDNSISDGRLRYTFRNTGNTSLSLAVMFSIPYFLNPKKVNCLSNGEAFPCGETAFPKKAEKVYTANVLPMSFTVHPQHLLNVEIAVSYVYQPRHMHSQEPQKGWDVPSVVGILYEKNVEKRVIVSNNLLVGIPAPDFSMLYNVIALTLAVFALGVGNTIDIVIQKRNYLIQNEVKSNLPTIVLILRSIYFALKRKFGKKEVEGEHKEENQQSEMKDETQNSENVKVKDD